MYTLMVLYGTPDDPEAFRAHYRNKHLPLVQGLPGVRAIRYGIDLSTAEGQPPYIAVFEADFDSADAMAAAFASPEGVTAQSDTQNFASGGVQILHFQHRSASDE